MGGYLTEGVSYRADTLTLGAKFPRIYGRGSWRKKAEAKNVRTRPSFRIQRHPANPIGFLISKIYLPQLLENNPNNWARSRRADMADGPN